MEGSVDTRAATWHDYIQVRSIHIVMKTKPEMMMYTQLRTCTAIFQSKMVINAMGSTNEPLTHF